MRLRSNGRCRCTTASEASSHRDGARNAGRFVRCRAWSGTPSRADEPDEKDKTANRFQQKDDAREHRYGGCERAQLRDEIENDQCIDDRKEMPIDQTPQQHHNGNQGKRG